METKKIKEKIAKTQELIINKAQELIELEKNLRLEMEEMNKNATEEQRKETKIRDNINALYEVENNAKNLSVYYRSRVINKKIIVMS